MISESVRSRLLAGAGIAIAAISPTVAAAADAPTGGDAKVRAFVLSNISVAGTGDVGSCQALSASPLDIFAGSLPVEERAKYATADQSPALGKLMYQRLGFHRVVVGIDRGKIPKAKLPPGFDPSLPMTFDRAREIGAYNGFPSGKGRPAWNGTEVVYSSCSNPEDFPDLAKGHHGYTGKIAAGMNLDGKSGRNDFVGLDATRGVDNQLWRAVGCVKSFRDEGDPASVKATVLSSLAPTIVEIRDIDDPRNDPDVNVHIYAAREALTRDGRGAPAAGITFTPLPDPQLHAATQGRIVDGVLTTDPFDFNLQFKEQVIDSRKVFRSARLRVALHPDGSIEGSINGYQTLASFWEYIENRTQDSAVASGYSCPAIRQAIDRYADGFRDPETGKYTAISSSYTIVGVKAFLVDPAQASPSGGAQ